MEGPEIPDLDGTRIGVLVSDGFEQEEFNVPVEALQEAGAKITVLAEDERHLEHIKGVNHLEPGEGTSGDRLLEDAKVDDFDALLVPGGAVSPDTMRQSRRHLDFVRGFVESGKPVALICHGPWLLADSGLAQGRKLTSWQGIRKDMERAGAHWLDQPVVQDGNLLTSRKPGDLPAFTEAFAGLIASAGARGAARQAA